MRCMLCLFPDFNRDQNLLSSKKSKSKNKKVAKKKKGAKHKKEAKKLKKQKTKKSKVPKTNLCISSSIIFNVIVENLDMEEAELARRIFDKVCQVNSVSLIYTERLQSRICSQAMVAKRYSKRSTLSQRETAYVKGILKNHMEANPIWTLKVYATEFISQGQFQQVSVENANPPAGNWDADAADEDVADEDGELLSDMETSDNDNMESSDNDMGSSDGDDDDGDDGLPTRVPLPPGATTYQGNIYVHRLWQLKSKILIPSLTVLHCDYTVVGL